MARLEIGDWVRRNNIGIPSRSWREATVNAEARPWDPFQVIEVKTGFSQLIKVQSTNNIRVEKWWDSGLFDLVCKDHTSSGAKSWGLPEDATGAMEIVTPVIRAVPYHQVLISNGQLFFTFLDQMPRG
jgi:hypothetical protein